MHSCAECSYSLIEGLNHKNSQGSHEPTRTKSNATGKGEVKEYEAQLWGGYQQEAAYLVDEDKLVHHRVVIWTAGPSNVKTVPQACRSGSPPLEGRSNCVKCMCDVSLGTFLGLRALKDSRLYSL